MYLFSKVTKTMCFINYFCYEKYLRVNSIRAYLEKFIAIEDVDWNFFISKLKEQVFEKKTDLLKVGDIENHISFIKNGIVRFSLPMKKEDKEVTFGFCFENEFVSAYDSFLKRTPSLYKIETLTKVNMWSISYDDLQEVYTKTKIGNLLGRLSSERLFLIKSKREQSLLSETAEQRYLNLFKERPNIIKEIPLKYIASYIGVTPQALSRIRRRIS